MLWSNIYNELTERLRSIPALLSVLERSSPELGTKLWNTPEIRHIDLWHEQIDYLGEEHPFPSPAVFIGFTAVGIEDNGIQVQDLRLQVDFYIFWETFADSYYNATMQDNALEYLNLLTLLNSLLHGYSGENFATMRRVGFARMESGGAGNLYRLSFETSVRDYSAQELSEIVEMLNQEVVVDKDKGKISRDDAPLFDI